MALGSFCLPPKAGVAGSIPAGRTNSRKAFSGFPPPSDSISAAKLQLALLSAQLSVAHPVRQMISRQVRVPLHHLQCLPSAKLLEHLQRCASLNVPARPSVPQIVPAKVTDTGAFHGTEVPNKIPLYAHLSHRDVVSLSEL
jgi:hypothetical protein